MSDIDLFRTLIGAAKRAETSPESVLQDSFVPVGSLMAHLDSAEHHVLFGRRGTGKTHVLRYIKEQKTAEGLVAVYIDLRRVGSPEDIYSSKQGDFLDQATPLLVDVVEAIHEAICDRVLDDRWHGRLDALSAGLDALAAAATQIRVVGDIEVERHTEDQSHSERSRELGISLARDQAGSAKLSRRAEQSKRHLERTVNRGHESHHVLLGPLSAAIQSIANALAPQELWLLIDEWSALPIEIQPLMADLLRRTFLAISGVVVKISAVHGRSIFREADSAASPIGLELGADTAASLDLDDFLLFRNDSAATLDFYAELLFRHVTAVARRIDRPNENLLRRLDTPNSLIRELFASQDSFHHLVLGAEGVPRDALQIAGLAAGAAYGRPITSAHVTTATRDFYLRDKERHLSQQTHRVFSNLIEQCARQRSRIIPLRRDGESNENVIQRLYDARLIHRVRQGVSLDPQHPSEVYDIYVIDYGCFLGLLTAGRIRTTEDGLDPGARFADSNEVEIRGRTFVRMVPGWYRKPRQHHPL
jgi:hypothetical protein